MQSLSKINQQRAVILGLIATIIVLAMVILLGNQQDDPQQETSVSPTPTILKGTYEDFGYSIGMIAEHDTPSDCRTIIDNRVYIITDFVTNHPDRDTLGEACGQDGTNIFQAQDFYSGLPDELPDGFQLIGVLAADEEE